MSNKLHKYSNVDKWKAYMPTKRDFFHDNYGVAHSQDLFHAPSASAYKGNSPDFKFGIQKRISRISGMGVNTSIYDIGESGQ